MDYWNTSNACRIESKSTHKLDIPMTVNCMYVLGGRLGDTSLLPHTGKSRIEGKDRLAA